MQIFVFKRKAGPASLGRPWTLNPFSQGRIRKQTSPHRRESNVSNVTKIFYGFFTDSVAGVMAYAEDGGFHGDPMEIRAAEKLRDRRPHSPSDPSSPTAIDSPLAPPTGPAHVWTGLLLTVRRRASAPLQRRQSRRRAW